MREAVQGQRLQTTSLARTTLAPGPSNLDARVRKKSDFQRKLEKLSKTGGQPNVVFAYIGALVANDSIVSTRPSNALKGAPRHTLRRRPLRFPNKAAKYMAWILRLATNLWQSPWCGACPRGVAAQLWRSRGARGSHCTALPHSAGFTAARAGHHHARRSSCGPGGAYMNWIRELDMNIKTKDAKYTP